VKQAVAASAATLFCGFARISTNCEEGAPQSFPAKIWQQFRPSAPSSPPTNDLKAPTAVAAPGQPEVAQQPFLNSKVGAEQWSLRSVARCIAADFKQPRQTNARVRFDCGEDAFFVSRPTNGIVTVGIADGVGGWAEQGIDPALFAWELMNRCQDVAEESAAASPAPSSSSSSSSSSSATLCQEHATGGDPKRVLTLGFERLQRSPTGAPQGSSTACVATLDCTSGSLRVANLGDSGALLFKGSTGNCVMESVAQQHRFNCPFQMMAAPFGMSGGDHPSKADVYMAQAEEGDILVLATDGMFDNVSTEQTTSAISEMLTAEPSAIAERLVRMAESKSHGREDTPFSTSARRHGYRHFGGKPDDITVVVARVERKKNAE